MNRCGIFLLVLLATQLSVKILAAEEKVEPAPPKKGVQPAPPLSADPPDAYSQLPTFGTIKWETTKLPWVEEGPYAGISGVAMDVHNGKIVVAGGFIPGGDETDDRTSRKTSRWCWVYDPATDKWSQLADAPDRREYGRGLCAGDNFYVFGGGKQYQKQDPPYRPHGECFALDLLQQPPVWRPHSQLNVPRTHMAVGRVGNYLVVAGGNEYVWAEKGYSQNTIRNTTEVFDLSQPKLGWRTRSPIPAVGRGWSAAAASQDHLYVLGGVTWNESGKTVGLRETWRYSPQQDVWEKRTPPPVAISGWAGALYQQRYAVIVGGVMRDKEKPERKSVWSDLAWVYDVQDDQWQQLKGALPPGAVFNDSAVVIIGDTLYVLGGEGPKGSHYNYFLKGRL
ncbi:N-acetylneuraminate epimerase precursor [Symmachiella dynata]|uniref:N-acetylneuraminate epimerase n=1 Tax=Symmachiella dynata TaxID=2527995 RepID=A0A517ZXY4_9PLAN|nr:kelch repeat-containing protein [Symmachiella dynata]QDU47341.1 N-acetylneuraminate epimerase precursor [Symmachiella dynata]